MADKPTNSPSIWERLEKTPTNFTKPFTRPGFSGTAINPTYMAKRLSEVLGPNGQGWRMVIEEERWAETAIELWDEKAGCGIKQVIHFVRAHMEWKDPESGTIHKTSSVYGATSLYQQRRDGSVVVDEETPKKSLTDAFSKAAVLLGAGADIHMGRYDDSKYVAALQEEEAVRMEVQTVREDTKPKRTRKPTPEPTEAATALYRDGEEPLTLAQIDHAVEMVDHVENGLPVLKVPNDSASDEMRERGIATIETVFTSFVETLSDPETMREFWRMNRNALGYVKNAAPDAYERILGVFTGHAEDLKGEGK